MKKKVGTSVAVRPDTIVEARYSLTPEQNNFLDIFLSEIDDEDSNNLEYTLELKKYVPLFHNGKNKNIYRDLSKAVSEFENKGFSIISENKKEHYAWFSRIVYNAGEGSISLEIGKSFKEVLIQMKRAAYYNLRFSLGLKNSYAKRIYYMTKQFEDTGIRIDLLDDLRIKLDCPPSYKKYGLFKTKVLDVAIKEINEKTDIFLQYFEVYEKNKVTRIKFIIKKKQMIEGNTYTNFGLAEEEYEELRRCAHSELEEEYKEESERYVIWTASKMNPDKVKTSKKAYLKKVITSEDNKNEFMQELKRESSRQKVLNEQDELEKQWEREAQETIQRKMKEHGVNSPEELREKLAEIFAI